MMHATMASRVTLPCSTTASHTTTQRRTAAPLASSSSSSSRHLSHNRVFSRRMQLRASNDESEQGTASEQPSTSAAEKPVDPEVAKGQRTAIITGAISIIFGVAYLALVSFLDSRGGELLPPPPEAFGL